MKRALVFMGTLAILAGTHAGRLRADDQPLGPATPAPYAFGPAAPNRLAPAYQGAPSPLGASDFASAPGPSQGLASPPAYGPYGTLPASAPAYGPYGALAAAPAPAPTLSPSAAPGDAVTMPFAPMGNPLPASPAYAPPNDPPVFGPASAAAEGVSAIGPHWTGTAEALFLYRMPGQQQVLGTDFLTGQDVLNARLVLEWGTGVRIESMLHLPDGWELEASGFDMESDGTRSFVAVPPSFGVFAPLLTDQVVFDSVSTHYYSALSDGEFNVRRQLMMDRVTILAGLRWLRLREEESLLGNSVLVGSDFALSKILNDLYGFQMGADLKLFRDLGPLSVNGLVKAGIFVNQITRDATNTGVIGVVAPTSAHQVMDLPAFVAEATLRGTYQLTEHLALTASYEVLCLGGVALAPDYFSTVINIEPQKTLLYHGGLAGIQARW